MDAQDDKYELKGLDADAKGIFTDNGFLVEAGSTAQGGALIPALQNRCFSMDSHSFRKKMPAVERGRSSFAPPKVSRWCSRH